MLTPTPTIDHLYQLFPYAADRPQAESIAWSEIPDPYRELLVHAHHMTVTVEAFYKCPVDVRVLACRRDGEEYARKILLALRGDGRIVQFGLVRIDLAICPIPVRDAIVEGKTPLGRVLIQNDMLRRIEPTEFLRVHLDREMAGWFKATPGTEAYGRMGVIYTGDRPAVEVLEILAPIPADPR